MAIVCLSSAPAIADAPADSRIARCQDLVRRQSSGADFLSATWRIWEDPVPKKALPALAATKIKPHDLLYDGGIGGLFRLKAAAAPFAAFFGLTKRGTITSGSPGVWRNRIRNDFPLMTMGVLCRMPKPETNGV